MIPKIADGIYLHLTEDAYHADPAIGASGICDLLVSPAHYWRNSPLNEQPEDDEAEDTAAQAFGHYFHDMLSGDVSKYVTKPAGMSFATKEGKAFRDENAGKTFVKDADHATATGMIDAMDRAGLLKEFAGISEVSFFWTENGQRFKIRLDRIGLAANGRAFGIDWKTFQNSMRKDMEAVIAHTVAAERYHVKAAWYQRGMEAMKKMIRERKGSAFHDLGAGADAMQIFDAFADHPATPVMFYCFVEKDRFPEIVVRSFVSHAADGLLNSYFKAGQNEIKRALSTYRQCIEQFGTGTPWRYHVYVKAFADEDFAAARWILED